MTDTSRSRLLRPKRGAPLRLRDGDLGNALGLSGGEVGAQAPSQTDGGKHKWLLTGIRYVLPVVVTLCGLAIMALGSETDLEGGASIVSAGLAIYFLNWLFRIGVSGDRERDTEEAARDYFAQHGRWPS
jgi:hypothetical protein